MLFADRKVLRSAPNCTVAGTLFAKSRCHSDTRDFMKKKSKIPPPPHPPCSLCFNYCTAGVVAVLFQFLVQLFCSRLLLFPKQTVLGLMVCDDISGATAMCIIFQDYLVVK
jgi:hypothetical protein